MTSPNYRVRRATLDDIDQLTSLWQSMKLPGEELGRRITAGRREEFKAFAAFQDPARRHAIADPQAESSFAASRLRWDETGFSLAALPR